MKKEAAEIISWNILEKVIEELERAEKFPPFNSSHEGYAVILEEMDELWHEVKHGDIQGQEKECIQVAAMALKLLQFYNLISGFKNEV